MIINLFPVKVANTLVFNQIYMKEENLKSTFLITFTFVPRKDSQARYLKLNYRCKQYSRCQPLFFRKGSPIKNKINALVNVLKGDYLLII